MPRAYRRLRWWLLALGVLLVGGATWAFTLGADTSKHVAARLFRDALGPPEPIEPPPIESVERALSEEGPIPDERTSAEPQSAPDELTETEMEPGSTGLALGSEPAVVPPPPPPPPRKPHGLSKVSFVLLLGMDNRTDRVTGRTDTMIIAAFRHRDGKVGAFSVPRDLWVEESELGPMRMSAAVRIGNIRLGKGKGVPLLRTLIEQELGIRIDRYAAVDLAGFIDVVDQVGGIEVDVQCPIKDCLRMAKGEPCEALSLEAGRQSMDGRTALKFVRSRHGRGDRDRRRRQRAVIIAFARALRAQGLTGLRDFWDTVEPFVETDLNWKSAAYYGSFAIETDLDELRGFSIARGMVRKHVTEKKQHVLRLDHEMFDQALEEMFDHELPGLRQRKHCPDVDAAAQARARR